MLIKTVVNGFLAVAIAMAADPQIPRKAPPLGIQVAQDKYVWLDDYAGKTRVVAFILTTCSHCQFTTGILNRLQKDYAAQDVQVLASAIEPMSSLNIPDFRKKFTPAFPVGYNEQSYASKFLGLPEGDPMFVPQIVIVDRDGMIRAQLAGEDKGMLPDVQEKTLRQAIEAAIKQGRTASRPSAPGK